MRTIVPRKLTATSVNGISCDANGNITLPVDSEPILNSTSFITSGAVFDALKTKVNKTGDTMSGQLTVKVDAGEYAFSIQKPDTTNIWAAVSVDYDGPSQQGRAICFHQIFNPSEQDYEVFKLPYTYRRTSGGEIEYDILTTKRTVTIAQGGTGASTSAAACENIGAVKKTGDTMTGILTLNVPNGVGLNINPSEITAYRGVSMRYRNAEASGVARTVFYQFKSNNTNYDVFKIPSTTLNQTTNNEYDLLSSRDAVTISQGGTGATTASDACTNLGAVKKSGDTVTGPLIFSNGNNYLGINFKGANGAPTVGFKNTGTRMTLDQYADESVGGERFLMPVPEVRSADVWYSILTSKNAVTVAQGGTGAANAKTARENLGLKTESIALTFTSGVAHQTGTSGIVCGHLIQINECVKLSADKAAGATWFSIPYTSAKWAYGTVQDASGFIATCHLTNGNVIVDQAVKASEHQYPQIIITSRIDD